MKKILYLIFVITFYFSCQTSVKPETQAMPKRLFSEKEMIEILTEVQIANSAVERKSGGNPDLKMKQRQEYLRAIFEKFNIDKQEFWDNYNYYAANPEKLDTIYAQIKVGLEKRIPTEEERMKKNPPPLPPAPPKPTITPALPNAIKGGKPVVK